MILFWQILAMLIVWKKRIKRDVKRGLSLITFKMIEKYMIGSGLVNEPSLFLLTSEPIFYPEKNTLRNLRISYYRNNEEYCENLSLFKLEKRRYLPQYWLDIGLKGEGYRCECGLFSWNGKSLEITTTVPLKEEFWSKQSNKQSNKQTNKHQSKQTNKQTNRDFNFIYGGKR